MKMIARRALFFSLFVFPVLPAAACGKLSEDTGKKENGERTPLDPSADWSPDSDWAAKGTREGENGDPYGPGPYADAAADAVWDMYEENPWLDAPPDVPPDDGDEEEDIEDDEETEEEDAVEEVDDAPGDEEDGGPDGSGRGGGEDLDERYVLYLSADDSNSQASPVIARWMMERGQIVPWSVVRIHEFLNYYHMGYPQAPPGEVAVSSQFRAIDFDAGLYALQIAVASESMDPSSRMPLNVTLVLDTSGSMSGRPIELEREVVRAIASQLEAGDMVSAVEWDTSQSVRLDSHEVAGPDDPAVLSMASSLVEGGGTDLHAGLTTGYALARRNYAAGRLNRVVLISDGQANAGITDIEIISEASEDSESEGIYLVGVGTGEGYNDMLMDEVTDAGKGAYIFVHSEAEARKMFVDRFLQSMQIAARNVQVELTLPGVFRMHEFFGEEYSTVEKEVDPQHLAPDDAMVFHQLLKALDPDRVYADDVISVRVFYTTEVAGPRMTAETSDMLQDLIKGGSLQMRKADAVVVFAQALMRISSLVEEGERVPAYDVCISARSIVDESAMALDDGELFDIADLLSEYCPVVCPTCS